MDDQQLETLAYATDDFLASMLEIVPDPLFMTTIVLSRIVLINDHEGSGSQFRKLMKEVADNHVARKPNFH